MRPVGAWIFAPTRTCKRWAWQRYRPRLSWVAMKHPRRHILFTLGQLSVAACARQVAVSPGQSQTPSSTQPPARPSAQTAAATVAMPPVQLITVDLTHDVVCPWCRIGHHNLRTALKQLVGAKVEVRLHPFLLDPSALPEGVDLRLHLAERYGAANIEKMFDRVTATGKQYGLHFDFAKIRTMADTSLAHTLLAAAPTERQGQLLDALHKAHFEEGINPGDSAALLAVWLNVGLDKAAGEAALTNIAAVQATRQWALAAAERNLGGVPHFELAGPGGKKSLHGGQPAEVLLAALRGVMG